MNLTCDVCGKVYASPRALAGHRAAHRPKDECPVCIKPVRYLQKHLEAHVYSDGAARVLAVLLRERDQLLREREDLWLEREEFFGGS